ncbi:MAG: pyridoxamine 5'-phosphate oxidase [Bacteroidota bacterium]
MRQLVANFRNEYISRGINEKDIAESPFLQFEKWFEEAVKNKVSEPNALHLSTVSADGKPSGRVMLLKGFDERGFVFFTNYESRKSKEMENNNYASLTFFWHELFRQVRIEGKVYMVSSEESDTYFQSRPRGSQIGAIASAQSCILASRKDLEIKVNEIEHQYKNKPIPRPACWGGFRLSPTNMEFWQGRINRLHDRIRYELQQDNIWHIQRLFPLLIFHLLLF